MLCPVRIAFTLPAPAGTRLTPEDLTDPGEVTTLTLPNGRSVTGTVHAMRIIQDGQAARCILECHPTPDDT
jgi:hypothetical protein